MTVEGARIVEEPLWLELPPAGPARPSLMRQLARDRTALIGLVILVTMAAVTVLGPILVPSDPDAQDVAHRFAAPSAAHPLGTDNLGRDELTRILYGGRVSLLTALAVGALVIAIGVAVGAVSGFAGGLVDGVIMRIVDVVLAFPSLLLALAVAGFLGPGLVHLAIAMVAVWWVEYARLVRGLVLAIKERPFVEAARAVGLPPWRVAVRHVLPNLLPPVIVLATLRTGSLLLALAGLSFLGLGIAPPTPEWGAMLNDAQDYLANASQLMLYPGLAITIAVLGFNLLGDGLRDVLDPTLR
jgi:peptide/nickel transport system permease protein